MSDNKENVVFGKLNAEIAALKETKNRFEKDVVLGVMESASAEIQRLSVALELSDEKVATLGVEVLEAGDEKKKMKAVIGVLFSAVVSDVFKKSVFLKKEITKDELGEMTVPELVEKWDSLKDEYNKAFRLELNVDLDSSDQENYEDYK